jgi:hypothetical protein
MNGTRTCPYLKEVVMLYCDLCPVKKLLPRDHVVSLMPCSAQDFKQCPLYRELRARLDGTNGGSGQEVRGPLSTEVSS